MGGGSLSAACRPVGSRFQPGFEAEGANLLFNGKLRKLPSGSKVRFFFLLIVMSTNRTGLSALCVCYAALV